MKSEFFAVYDSKVRLFAEPFFMRTIDEALRGFRDVANNPETNICKYSEDYSLFHLGSYDSTTGVFTNNSAPYNLGLASSLKTPLPTPLSSLPKPQSNLNQTGAL